MKGRKRTEEEGDEKMTSKRLLTVACMLLILMLAAVLVYITNSVAVRIGVFIVWAVVNLAFLRLQEQWEKEGRNYG